MIKTIIGIVVIGVMICLAEEKRQVSTPAQNKQYMEHWMLTVQTLFPFEVASLMLANTTYPSSVDVSSGLTYSSSRTPKFFRQSLHPPSVLD